jgi:6-phosphogluconolactonase
MVDRRTFTTLLAGTIAAPTLAFGKTMTSRNVFYSAVGPQLTPYGVDVDKAELTKRDPVSTAANIQYAWPHPSKRWLYVVSSSGGPAAGDATGSVHVANAFTIDPATGALKPHGETVKLATRPIHASVDRSGHFLLIAYNNPSSLTVHRINADGTIGDKVEQPNKLDTGIFAHQIRLAPDNKHVILVTRGNNAPSDNPVDPGSIKVFTFKDGVLANLSAIAPGDGMHFGPRHLDFHPKKPWVFVSIESQNQLMVYKLDDKTGLSRDPLFTKNTPGRRRHPRQPRWPFCLRRQPRLVDQRLRRQEGVYRWREFARSVCHQSDHRRADLDPERRRPRQLPADLQHRPFTQIARRRPALVDRRARRQ